MKLFVSCFLYLIYLISDRKRRKVFILFYYFEPEMFISAVILRLEIKSRVMIILIIKKGVVDDKRSIYSLLHLQPSKLI